MHNAVTFLSGCFTFLAVQYLKAPIKKASWRRACRGGEQGRYGRYRRYNFMIFFLVTAVAMGAYSALYHLVGLDHFKLCCTLKAGAMAVALYAVYEQWTGSESAQKETKELRDGT